MKKFIFTLLISVIVATMSSCGGSDKDAGYENLTPLQRQAVTYVKKHLEKGDKLIEAQVVEEPLPAAVLEQPFLNLRNVVFKAGLDYQTNRTRGLEAGMEMAKNKISQAREQILATDSMLTANIGSSNSVIVLAKVKSRKSVSGLPSSLIVAFDPETMEAKEWIPVTTPVQNTVALVVCAEDNMLFEYSREQNHDTEMLVSKVSDPVLKFVLEANAL